MKTKLILNTALFAVLISTSCKTKKTEAIGAEVLLPEVVINSKLEHKTYYASYTRLSDIIHTKLEVNLNWDSCFVYGKANLKVRPYFYDADELILDAKGFKINDVKINSKVAKYKYDGYKLTIALGRKFTKEETYNVFIDYVAMPNRIKVKGSAAITSDKGFYFINPDGKDKLKPTQFWTQGETESNSCWFPTIESGNEKFSQEIAITIDTAMVSLSNGRLMYSTNNSNGTRTDYWKQDLPHAPYLVMLAGGKFSVYKDKWRNMEVNYYMEPEFAPNAKLIFGNTPEMIEFFSNITGVSYPWDKYSQIVVRDFVSGAMENTGAVTFYGAMNKTVRDYEDRTDEDIISHELFHHWFGDLVTCESWPNLTLNEGFATYGEYLWDEYKYGRDEADKGGMDNLNAYLNSSKSKRVDLIRFDLSDRETMFDANSYQKGGKVIHMLRKYVGDKAFFAAIKLYLDTYKFKPVEIHHLRLAFEEITGEDLNWFFNQWYLNQGHPELEINYNYDEASKLTRVTISQKQDLNKNPLYRLPIDVDVYEKTGVSRRRIVLDTVSQTFEFATPEKPFLVNIDAEKMLVGTKKDNHTKEEWLYMYKNAPLFLDRYEALNGLDKDSKDSLVQLTIVAALSDPFYSMRTVAISKVKTLDEKNLAIAYPIIKQLALNDKSSSVRARAIRLLNETYSKENNAEVYASAEKDLSYMVESSVLKIYASTNKEKAFELAKKEQSTENTSMQIAIAEFYGKEGTSSEHDFFLKSITRKSTFAMFFLMPQYKVFIKRMDDVEIKKGLGPVAELAKESENVFAKNAAKGVLIEMKSAAKSEELKAEIQALIATL